MLTLSKLVKRYVGPDGSVVARLTISDTGAEFWLADESPEHGNFSPESLNGSTVRLILVVADPDAVFAHACAAGAKQVHAVTEELRSELQNLYEISEPA